MTSIYELAGTKKTPYIKFDKNIGTLEIKGCSLHSDAVGFYDDLKLHIEEYIKNPANVTQLNFQIEYMNTSSSKVVFMIITMFEKIHDMGKNIEFNWYVEEDDPDMLEIGNEYRKSLKFNTNVIEISL